MKIVEIYSHLNGFEFIQYHKPQIWAEVEEVVAAVDAEALRTKISKEKRMMGNSLYSPVDLNKALEGHFAERGWSESRVSYYVTRSEKLARATMNLDAAEQKSEIEANGEEAIFSYNQTDFVKDRVAIEVQFGKYAFVAYDLFVKHMAFYSRNEIDCGIEILPMKSMQSQMSSGIGYYEGELYNVIRQGRGVPAVPLIVVGIDA